MEIIVTALDHVWNQKGHPEGHTSLLMFPIFGAGCLFRPDYAPALFLPGLIFEKTVLETKSCPNIKKRI